MKEPQSSSSINLAREFAHTFTQTQIYARCEAEANWGT
jgi:hypothetical protein